MESSCFHTSSNQIRMGLPKEQRADKKEHLQCGCNLAWMKKDGLILWNAVAICEMFKISWQMGEHLVRDDLENHLKDRFIPFGATVEYFPNSAQDQSGLHQFGKKVLPRMFFGCALVARGIWKGNILFAGIAESGNCTRQKSTLEDSMQWKL